MIQMNANDLAIAEKNLSDPLWRLSNLYHIVDKRGMKVRFEMNRVQQQLYRNLWYCNVILKARQMGISTFVAILFLDRCLFNSNVSAGVIAHTREDAEQLFKRIKFSYDNLPQQIKDLLPSTIDSARELKFSNGSSIRVGTSMRGMTLQYLHISEMGKICSKFPEKANEIMTGSLNTLAAGQYVIIESTAEGKEGHFFELCKQAQALQASKKELTKLDFRFHFFPWFEEPTYRIGSPVVMPEEMHDYFASLKAIGINLDPEQKFWYAARYATQQESMLVEYPATPAEAWASSIDGAYYAKKLLQARQEGRIGFVPYEENLAVSTSWDLGYNDSTAIWFFQVYNKEIRLIDYLEGSGESLSHWINLVKAKNYTFQMHLAPHDIKVTEYSSGVSRIVTARNLGLSFTPVPRHEIITGIDACRNILNRCFFDERKCAQGLKALENYKKEWNDRAGCWHSRPLHSWASHGADAFRTLAAGLNFVMNRQESNRQDNYSGGWGQGQQSGPYMGYVPATRR